MLNRLRAFLAQYQLVWWWPIIEVDFGSWDLGLHRPKLGDSWALIYKWLLAIGPLEIRKWVPNSESNEVLRRHREVLEEEQHGS